MATAEEIYLTDILHRKDFVRTTSGDLETVTGRANLKQAIFRRIMTTKGTIVHRPNYGVGLKQYQNELMTLDQQRALSARIDDQLPQDDRVEEVLGVRVENEDETPESLKITVRVKAVGLGEIEVTIRPFGEETVI